MTSLKATRLLLPTKSDRILYERALVAELRRRGLSTKLILGVLGWTKKRLRSLDAQRPQENER